MGDHLAALLRQEGDGDPVTRPSRAGRLPGGQRLARRATSTAGRSSAIFRRPHCRCSDPRRRGPASRERVDRHSGARPGRARRDRPGLRPPPVAGAAEGLRSCCGATPASVSAMSRVRRGRARPVLRSPRVSSHPGAAADPAPAALRPRGPAERLVRLPVVRRVVHDATLPTRRLSR